MGFGRILGGALQGIGKGKAIVAQNEMDAEAAELEHRRQLALENLRFENDSTARVQTADLNDRNDARSTARDLNVDLTKIDVQADVQEERDNRLHQQDVQTARLASQLRQGETAAQLRLADQLDRAARSGEVQGIEIDGATGEKVIVFKDGRTQPTGIKATERELNPSASSYTPSVLEQTRGLGTPAPAATQRPAAPAPAPTTKPNAQQSSSKTYTMADAQATAKKHNVSIEEVHKRMRDAGYKLAGS